MLAYVFWHWRQPEVSAAEYETSLREFHESLRAHRPDGFLKSASFRIAGAPWTPAPDAYEDWYLIEDFTALGLLNEASVLGARKQPHDSVARLAAGGAGGVYRMLFGKTNPFPRRQALWFDKPPGMNYADLDSEVIDSITDVVLWRRQLVLGPAPEFCLHGSGGSTLNPGFSPVVLPLSTVFSFE